MNTFRILAIASIAFLAPVASYADTSWQGLYIGGQYTSGTATVEDINASTSATGQGIHLGYNHEMPQGFILGAEIDYTASSSSTDTNTHYKLKIGTDLGNLLVYGLAGATQINSSEANVDPVTHNGVALGAGISTKVGESVILGLEYIHDIVDLTGAPYTLKANTLALRASFQF